MDFLLLLLNKLILMFDESYNTVSQNSEGIYREKGSKFLGFCFHVKSETEVKEILAKLRKEYFDARHHCYAYRLGWDKSVFRFNDDGEPSGTAGRPIYGQLLSSDLTNTLVVVVRYFGGVKLGVGGLISAYKTAAFETIRNNKIETKPIRDLYKIHFQYAKMNNVMNCLKNNSIEIIENQFNEDCNIQFCVVKTESVRIYDAIFDIGDIDIQFIKTY